MPDPDPENGLYRFLSSYVKDFARTADEAEHTLRHSLQQILDQLVPPTID